MPLKGYLVWVCVTPIENVPEVLLWEIYSLTVNERRLNTNKVLSCVKSDNFIKDKHECKEQVNTMNNKSRMTVRPPT